MSEPHPEPPASPVEPATQTPAPSVSPSPVAHTPVKRVGPRQPARKLAKAGGAPARPPEERRDFFSEAMREAMGPLSGLLERKIHPILAALEAIPDDVDRLANNLSNAGAALDQPQILSPGKAPKNWPLAEAPAPETPLRFLRPPGATPGEFESLCSSCGRCLAACPAQAIRVDSYGLVADGRPYIVAATQPCVVCSDLACMNVCPTGALKLTERLKIRMGTAKVNLDLCLRENGEDCRLCVEACPIMGQGAGEAGDALAIHEASGRIRVRRNACIGCGLCESRCPTGPAAITVEPYRPPTDPIVA